MRRSEVTIERDLTALQELIARLVPGSRVRVETVGDNVVLTGSVPTPIDATRAGEIVNSFLGPLVPPALRPLPGAALPSRSITLRATRALPHRPARPGSST
jgi:Flp pilus assembly secretin CpaC